jgi:mRNA interferase RelE/StbE
VVYEIIWTANAERQLRKLDRSVGKRIFGAVEKLAEDPFRTVLRLVNSPYYRLRVGDYRVIVDIQEGKLLVLVLMVGHRKKIYD